MSLHKTGISRRYHIIGPVSPGSTFLSLFACTSLFCFGSVWFRPTCPFLWFLRRQHGFVPCPILVFVGSMVPSPAPFLLSVACYARARSK